MASWSIETIPSFCITLERRIDRWKRFQDQPGIQGLSVKRFLGVDGKTIDYMNDSRVTLLTKRNIKIHARRSHEELDSVGGIGCALSHIAIWKWMVENNQEMCLILEDDAVVPPNFIATVNECISKSVTARNPKNWELWSLGGIWDDITEIPQEPPSSGVVQVGSFALFHAYVITLSAAQRFLKEVYPIHCHIDFWVSIYCHFFNLRIIGCKSIQLEQYGKTTTDIQNENGCTVCAVPIGYDKTHTMVSLWDWRMARASQAICIGFVAYYAYQKWYK
jgi:GR25 family glycosyltransferase involved in LPS biosynthesis